MRSIMRKILFFWILVCLLLAGCSLNVLPQMSDEIEEDYFFDENIDEYPIIQADIEAEFEEDLLWEDPDLEPTPTPFQPIKDTPIPFFSDNSTPYPTPLLESVPATDVVPTEIDVSGMEEALPEEELVTEEVVIETEEEPIEEIAADVSQTVNQPTKPVTLKNYPNPIPAKRGFPKPAPDFSSAVPGRTINILLLGSDVRAKGSFRTDTLMIASIRPEEQSVSLISIPRDLYVYIPSQGMHKINTAFLWGQLNKYPGRGVASLKDTIYYNLGVRIDHYVVVNFQGFRRVVDILDGIDMPLSCPFTDWHYINPNLPQQWSSNRKLTTIGPGVVHMDGDLALWYARSRMNSSDYDRSRRQQEVLRGLYSKAMRLDVLSSVPELYKQVTENIRTDLKLGDILELVPMALNFDEAKIRSYYITAGMVKPTNINGMYAQYPKTDKIYKMILKALSPPVQKVVVRESTSVEVCNASGKADRDVLAAERLHYVGFRTIACSIDLNGSQKKTEVVDLGKDDDNNLLSVLLSAFTLPSERVTDSAEPDSKANYRIILGKDFDPCFSPYRFTH